MERWPRTTTVVLASVCGMFASILTYAAFLAADFAIYIVSAESDSASVLLRPAVDWLSMVAALGVGLGAAGLVYRLTRGTWGNWAILFGAGSLGWLIAVIGTELLAPYYAVVGGVIGATLMVLAVNWLLSRARILGGPPRDKARRVAS